MWKKGDTCQSKAPSQVWRDQAPYGNTHSLRPGITDMCTKHLGSRHPKLSLGQDMLYSAGCMHHHAHCSVLTFTTYDSSVSLLSVNHAEKLPSPKLLRSVLIISTVSYYVSCPVCQSDASTFLILVQQLLTAYL